MDNKLLRKNMESLWKETFRDSSEYVTLVFDRYFNPDNVVYSAEGDALKASLLGVPYEFSLCGGKESYLKGLYLCGLATKTEFRKQGIMSGLLEKINKRAQEAGYDFTFLIPAGDEMKPYYRKRGYHDSFYKVDEYFVKGHDFGNEKKLVLKELEDKDISSVVKFLTESEDKCNSMAPAYVLRHDEADWETVVRECLLSGDKIFIWEETNETEAVAFTTETEEGLKIKTLKCRKEQNEKEVLAALNKMHEKGSLIIARELYELRKRPDKEKQIWAPFSVRNNGPKAEYEDLAEDVRIFDQSRNAVPFGMIRIFNIKSLLNKTGMELPGDMVDITDDQLISLLLRRKSIDTEDSLEKLLDLPEIMFSMSQMLE